MQYIDIATLVKDALLSGGCAADMIGDLDSHSTIALDFNWSPTIYVGRRDDDIWLWSRLCEYHENSVDLHAASLLKEMMKKLSWVRNDHLCFNEDQGYLELRGLVALSALEDGEKFREALEGFLERADTFRALLK
ncbi:MULTISPECIES: hypothetical protein [unclassified Undibacterium]|uniref:InvB/SpaK family type III secretion system chaperone n=1 Tax=unclassified Undibacterium TaxID=2630295 RepID=UPI002AC90078|nr:MULTISPECIES: hypothetical protein [unclassified Undibacterium]MEB0140393.1 hypothetical protein [Undibacterium sp. CCC2.1]MEB0173427.1 hypothetical protein [Undibacterium sp. CCC1.1]MEB0177327.1 hypothetical protein [Undibacterium sp. CCC3.4]MEB0216584.1 hypothetical protein [Undibacterium sp. 5I2]WPX43486.1 hypothetical protein RHM61_19275 [Undibacterium sp. CCC3.4]